MTDSEALEAARRIVEASDRWMHALKNGGGGDAERANYERACNGAYFLAQAYIALLSRPPEREEGSSTAGAVSAGKSNNEVL